MRAARAPPHIRLLPADCVSSSRSLGFDNQICLPRVLPPHPAIPPPPTPLSAHTLQTWLFYIWERLAVVNAAQLCGGLTFFLGLIAFMLAAFKQFLGFFFFLRRGGEPSFCILMRAPRPHLAPPRCTTSPAWASSHLRSGGHAQQSKLSFAIFFPWSVYSYSSFKAGLLRSEFLLSIYLLTSICLIFLIFISSVICLDRLSLLLAAPGSCNWGWWCGAEQQSLPLTLSVPKVNYVLHSQSGEPQMWGARRVCVCVCLSWWVWGWGWGIKRLPPLKWFGLPPVWQCVCCVWNPPSPLFFPLIFFKVWFCFLFCFGFL